MLQGIEFKNKRFDTNNDNNLFVGLTKNVIVICNNRKLMISIPYTQYDKLYFEDLMPNTSKFIVD